MHPFRHSPSKANRGCWHHKALKTRLPQEDHHVGKPRSFKYLEGRSNFEGLGTPSLIRTPNVLITVGIGFRKSDEGDAVTWRGHATTLGSTLYCWDLPVLYGRVKSHSLCKAVKTAT